MGNQVNAGELNSVANEHGETILINSIVDLDSTLQHTVNNTIITGELTSFDADGTLINIGADGGQIDQITIYDQANNPTTYSYDPANPTQTITTPLGATLTLNFESGSYTYTIDFNATNAGLQERLDISASDSDGVTASNTLVLHLQINVDENFSYDANVDIDGLDGYDTLVLSGAETLDFNNISNLSNIEAIDMGKGDNDILNLDVADIINMTDSSNTLTIYGDSGDSVAKPVGSNDTWTQVQSGVDDGKGHTVDVYNISDGTTTVTVNIEQEIVVS